MGRIFLSHASEEHELVIHLANHLEKNNLRAWYAPRDIMGGIDYDKEIIAAIKDCRAFVLLLSRNSDASEDVKTEVYHAVKYHKQVICLDVDDVEPENLSYLLGMRHRLNWLERRDETLDKLVHDIKRIPEPEIDYDEAPEPENKPEPVIQPSVPKPKPEPKTEPAKNLWDNYRLAVIAIVILCATGVISVLISKPGYVKPINMGSEKPVETEKPVNYDVISLAANGKLEDIREAINAGADVNAKDNKGATALIRASWEGNLELAELLLKHGADVNARNDDGCTALMFAAFDGHPKIAEVLIAYGANKNLRDKNGSTAYDYVRYVRKGSSVRKGKGFSASLLQRLKPDR